MSRTPSSIPETQTGHNHPQSDAVAAGQSPPLISDQKEGNTGNDVGDEAEDSELKTKMNQVCVIDVKNDEEEEEEERDNGGVKKEREKKVCRICQLGSDHMAPGVGTKMVHLVELGCACKGELGLSHYYCALAWFTQKGNRTCEICEKPAKNIKGIGDTGFSARAFNFSSHERGVEERENRCSKSLCNFLLAAIVLAFFLPWFLHPGRLL